MIDYQAFILKYQNFEKSKLEKIITESINQFPKKVSSLIMHCQKANFGEARFFSINIRESFAFIFHDSELNNLCHKIDDASVIQDVNELRLLSEELSNYSKLFLEELKKLFQKIHD